MNFIGAAVTDTGIVKKVNQDSLTLKVAHSPRGMVCMAVICDGLGGLSLGEVASGNVILAFDRWFREELLNAGVEWTEESIKREWEMMVFSMNVKIREYGVKQGKELGTTVTASLFIGDFYYVIHVGDSRLYEIDRSCRLITKDQTLIAQEVERGMLTKEQALTDSRRNVLLQCVGVTQNLAPSFLSGRITPNAAYLLCSDGFRHLISEEEIYQTCNAQQNISQETIHENLYQLVELNKQRGERDNISAILVQTGDAACWR